MKTRLRPVLSIVDGESPTSYVSRLARSHTVGSARSLCLDIRVPFRGLVDGDEIAVARLAEVAGVEVETLGAHALRRTEDGATLRGERLVRSTLRRSRVYACPACLAGDAASSDDPADASMAGRSLWLLEPMRTCAVHGVALVEIAMAASAHHLHDFALLLAPRASDVTRLAAEAVERLPSGLERYLLDRLDGKVGAAPWLDALPWHAAARTCEMLGVVATLGRTPNLNLLDGADWHRAGGAGFGIAREGEAGVRAFLADLQRGYPASSLGKEKAQAVFGRFHQWLAAERHPAFEPVRDLVFRHLHETTPVGPDDELFGRRFPGRRIHSIRTAALESGAHPKRLRKVLDVAGLLPAGSEDRLDHHVLFDAGAAAETLRIAAGTVSMVEAACHLNAGRVQTGLLVDAGHIMPVVTANADPAGFGMHGFAKEELDAFLARLTERAVPVEAAGVGHATIPDAARRAHRGAMEVVAMILDGTLAWVGRLAGERGYLAILVDGDEVRRKAAAPALPGLAAYKVARELGTTPRVVKGLVTVGALRVKQAKNPVTRTPVEIVAFADLERFRATFVSVVELAAERREHPFTLKGKLSRSGVQPAFEAEAVGASFYRRTQISEVVLCEPVAPALSLKSAC